MASYLCPIWIGLHVSDWMYASSYNVTVKLVGYWNNNPTEHYFYNVDFPYVNHTTTIWEDIDCEFGGLDYIELIANEENSLQVDYVDYVRFQGKDYYNTKYGYYYSYFLHYESDDTCNGSCCISTEVEPRCDEITSKKYYLTQTMDCDVDPCDELQEEVIPDDDDNDELNGDPDPYCSDGIIDEKNGVCCHSQCINSDGNPQCGGSGCSSIGLGYDYCCTANILTSNRECNDYSAPCYNYQEEESEESSEDSNEESSENVKFEKLKTWKWWMWLIFSLILLTFVLCIGFFIKCICFKPPQIIEANPDSIV